MRRPHRIPLSDQAMQLLGDAWDLSGPEGLVFPAERSGNAMSGAALLLLLRRLDVPATPSDFRRSFRDWCAESGVSPVLVKATTSRTSGRTDMLRQMRTLLQDWADYCLPDG